MEDGKGRAYLIVGTRRWKMARRRPHRPGFATGLAVCIEKALAGWVVDGFVTAEYTMREARFAAARWGWKSWGGGRMGRQK